MPSSPALGLVTALVTLVSGATLLTTRIARLPADAGWVATPFSGLGLVLFALGLASALLDRWGHARLLGALAALAGGAAALAKLWSLHGASPAAFSPAWLWSPSLQSCVAVCLAGLGLLLAEPRSTRTLRLSLLCLIGTVVAFISVNLTLALVLDFPDWVIGGSFAALALSPVEQRLLARELNDNLALALRSLGAAAAGFGLLLLAWNAERRAGYPWPRWFTPVTLLLIIWVSVALAGALWALEESDRSRPDPAAASRASTPLPEMTLAFGAVTAALLSVALRQTRRAMEAAELAKLTNRRLQDEIDERRQIQELLAEREARLRLTLERLPAILWTVDRDLRIASVSGAGLRDLKIDSQAVPGITLFELFETDDPSFPPIAAQSRALQGEPQDFELVFQERVLQARVEPLRDLEGRITGVIGVALDITERKGAEEQLRHLALHDPLTGLPNRAYLVQHLDALADGNTAREPRPFALLLLDLDGFKQVNDTLGHPAGDRLLVEVGRRLAQSVRSGDLVARLGGDEFVVVARGADERAALALAERIARELGRPIRLDGHTVTIRPSTGIAIGQPGHHDPHALLRDADIALYRAKALGRGRAVVFEPSMYRETVTRSRLGAQLREAFEREELSLRFQPIVELASGRLYGFSTALGWEHPERGIVPAEEIFSLAADAGISVPIGRWALRQAVSWLAEANMRLPEAPTVVLEVASAELIEPELADHLDRLLGEAGVPAERFGLALHGPVLLAATPDGIETLRALRARGVSLFVGGYELGGIPLDVVPEVSLSGIVIAPSLVSRLDEGAFPPVIVRALVELASELGLATLAQGVHTHEQARTLARFGCTLAQGELFGQPMDGTSALTVAQGARHHALFRPFAVDRTD